MNTRIKEILESSNLKDRELISLFNIDESVFYDWKNGYVYPSFDNLLKIADHFCVSVDYLLGRTDDFIEYHTKSLIPFNLNLENILKNKKITKYRFFKDCQFDNSLKTSWFKKGTKPNACTLIKMADYLNISMDELMGRVI